jgi:hypothetical protein
MRQHRERIKNYLDPYYKMLDEDDEEVDGIVEATTSDNNIQQPLNGFIKTSNIEGGAPTFTVLVPGTGGSNGNNQTVEV